MVYITHDPKSNVIENDRDRLINILNSTDSTSFYNIIKLYIDRFGDSISAENTSRLIEILSNNLQSKINTQPF